MAAINQTTCPHCSNVNSLNGFGQFTCWNCGGQFTFGTPKKRRFWKILVSVFAVWFLFSVLREMYRDAEEKVNLGLDPSKPTRQQIEDQLAILKKDWGRSGTGLQVNLVVTNGSNFAVKDLTFIFAQYGPSGTEVRSHTETIYRILPAHSSENYHINAGFEHSQATAFRAKIVDWSPASPL